MNAQIAFEHFSTGGPASKPVLRAISRAHHAIKKASSPMSPRASRHIQSLIFALVAEMQFFPVHLEGYAVDVTRDLDKVEKLIIALEEANNRHRQSPADRIRCWLRERRHPTKSLVAAFGAPPHPSRGPAVSSFMR
jgi:hypothetical protein